MRDTVVVAVACWLLIMAITFAVIGLYWAALTSCVLAYLLLDYWERRD